MKSDQKLTIFEVAAACGVSISTVSKALNGNKRISEATRKKVRETAVRLGYQPNGIARSLARQKSGNLAVFKDLGESWDAVRNPYVYEIFNGMEYAAREEGYLLSIINRQRAIPSWENIGEIIQQKKIDGLLVMAGVLDQELEKKLSDLQFPCLVIGEPDYPTELSWIDMDNEAAGEQAVLQLYRKGSRKIHFYANSFTADPTGKKRLSGIQRWMEGKKGLDFQNFLLEENEISRHLEKLVDSADLPDGIICSHSLLGALCLSTLDHQGITVPDTVKLIAFDRYPLSAYTIPPMSVIDMNLHELGWNAVHALLRVMVDTNLLIRQRICASTLWEGASL